MQVQRRHVTPPSCARARVSGCLTHDRSVRSWRTLCLGRRPRPGSTLAPQGDEGGRGWPKIGNGAATGGVLLVGSVPLGSADEVFQLAAVELGDRIDRIPDGETGPRSDWIVWQYPVLSSRPEFEVCPPGDDPHRSLPRLRVRDGESFETLRFDDLGYAQAAVSSYRAFARRKRDGLIPVHCRFQVSLPTPARADRRLRGARGPGPRRAALRGAHDARAGRHLRGHPARPAGRAVGHELRVRHARRRHGDVVQRPALQHRGAPGAARPEHPGRRAARLPLLPRPRAPPPGAALRRPAARRDRQRPVAEPRPARSTGSTCPSRRAASTCGSSRPSACCRCGPRPSSTWACCTRRTACPGAEARIVAAQRFVHDFGVATDCGWGRHRAQEVTALVELHRAVTTPTVSALAPAPTVQLAGRGGRACPTTTGRTSRWTPSAPPTTASTATAGTATSIPPWRSWPTCWPTATSWSTTRAAPASCSTG